MARKSRWSKAERKKLLKMVNEGVPEQEIREKLAQNDKPMTAVEFAQQLKMAMVEAGKIKQAKRTKTAAGPKTYEVTPKGRLTLSDFTEETGYQPGAKFTLEKPRGRSNAWRLVPAE
jgi:hypothetical protein